MLKKYISKENFRFQVFFKVIMQQIFVLHLILLEYVDVVRLTFAHIDCRVPKITKTAIFVLPKNKESIKFTFKNKVMIYTLNNLEMSILIITSITKLFR